MSKLQAIAIAIKDRIEEIEGLAGSVIVYHRKNIASEFESRMGKVKGKVVIVRLIEATNTSRNKLLSRFSGTYTVSVILDPALTKQDAQDVDLIIEGIAGKLHGWWPSSIPSNGIIFCDVDKITFPEDPDYQVSVLTLQAPKQSD